MFWDLLIAFLILFESPSVICQWTSTTSTPLVIPHAIPPSSPSSSNLSCFSCSTFDNPSCLKMTRFLTMTDQDTSTTSPILDIASAAQLVPVTDCSPDESYCQVTRVEYMTTDRLKMKFWALERGCSSTCREGCLIIGEGERTKLHMCQACCSGQSLCNISDGAVFVRPSIFSFVLLTTILILIGTTMSYNV